MNKQEIGTYLNSITKENLVAAMLVLDNQEIPRSRQSDEYDVINAETGKGYPPPYLIETAYKIATNNELPASRQLHCCVLKHNRNLIRRYFSNLSVKIVVLIS